MTEQPTTTTTAFTVVHAGTVAPNLAHPQQAGADWWHVQLNGEWIVSIRTVTLDSPDKAGNKVVADWAPYDNQQRAYGMTHELAIRCLLSDCLLNSSFPTIRAELIPIGRGDYDRKEFVVSFDWHRDDTGVLIGVEPEFGHTASVLIAKDADFPTWARKALTAARPTNWPSAKPPPAEKKDFLTGSVPQADANGEACESCQ